MIKVTNLAEKIKNNCFTQEEINILEFTVNNRKITIESQIKNYFKLSWYSYSEDELYDQIIIIKEENKDLLKQIADYKQILNISLNPYSYQLFKNSDINKDDDRLSASTSKSNITGKNTTREDIINNNIDTTQELNKVRSARSEINTISNLSDVWEDWSINKPTHSVDKLIDQVENGELKNYSLQSKELPETPLEHQPRKDHSYQYIDAQENLNKNISDSQSNIHSGSKQLSNTDTVDNNYSVSNVKGLKKTRSTEYSLGENMLKIAEIKLPEYRSMFWNKFNNLFLTQWD